MSTVIEVGMPTPQKCGDCKHTAWEKRNGKAVQSVDLARTMDPERLAGSAVDLNLKLMRWRLLPEIELDRVKDTKCLLIGAGTLGCNISRALIGWGVRNITFVDNGTVSYSNPVRQTLFEFADSVQAKEKAIAAAASLKRIFPGVVIECNCLQFT